MTAFIGKEGYRKEAPQLINANSLDVTPKSGSADASIKSISQPSELIERSKLDDDRVPNYHNADSVLKYAYLSSDITVEKGTPYTVTITVRKSPQKNKFWMHEIRAIKKEQGLSSSEVIDPQQEYNKTLAPDDIISQPSDSVKSKKQKRCTS